MKLVLGMLSSTEQLNNFPDLYEEYFDKIYRFVYYKTHHRETAEDITSDVFIKALKNIASFDQLKGTFQAWLFKIARNTVIDYYRRKKNLVNIDDVWSLGEEDSVLTDIDTKNQVQIAKKYLAKLNPIQREIVILRVWENMPYKEIADIIGQKEQACKMTFYRAMENIKKEMPLRFAIIILINKSL